MITTIYDAVDVKGRVIEVYFANEWLIEIFVVSVAVDDVAGVLHTNRPRQEATFEWCVIFMNEFSPIVCCVDVVKELFHEVVIPNAYDHLEVLFTGHLLDVPKGELPRAEFVRRDLGL